MRKKTVDLFNDLLENERTSGLLLLACTVVSLAISNSILGPSYMALWHREVAGNSLEFWINDGLMAIFFLMVGLELEREIYIGELSKRKQALLPAMAALGGMLVPAGIHLLFNHGLPTARGAGIPMATDIAFAIGILALLGNRVPLALKVFLTALAVIDDLGAIVTIAIFYSTGIQWAWLGTALGIYGVLLSLNRFKVHRLTPYLLLGVAMWWCMLHSGIHATITGVLLAFAIPFGKGNSESISWKLQHFLHKPVTLFIMPLFALANTCIELGPDWHRHLFTPNSYGIFLGLVVGKPLGIVAFSTLAVSMGICALPPGVTWRQLAGAGVLGGIGFTMSIFIAMLAFNDAEHIQISKATILLSSVVAGLIGFGWLRIVLPASCTIDSVRGTGKGQGA
jgi:NhaA family Na+:H+ antiporter